MVSALVAVVGTIGGTIAGGLIQHMIAQYREKETNQRVYGKIYAQREAEAFADLSQKTTQLYRFYLVNARRAAAGYIDEEEYYEEIHWKHEEYESSLSQAMPYVSEWGEDRLWRYHELLVGVDSYIQQKVDGDEEEYADISDGIDQFLQEDAKGSYYDVDIAELERHHEFVKNKLRDELTSKITRFAY